MTRITTTVFVLIVLMNGTVTVMAGSGFNEDVGVELAPGISESMDNAIQELRDGFKPSAGLGETLFTTLVAGYQVLNIVVNAITATPRMFLNLGFPDYIVYPLFAPMYAISTLELIYMATGRDAI